MLGTHASYELQHYSIIIINFSLIFGWLWFLWDIEHNPWGNTGDTVEQRLGQIHLPFPIPRSHYFLLILFLRVNGTIIVTCNLVAYFLLVHGKNVESLVEFYTLAGSDLCHMIFIQHFGIRSISVPMQNIIIYKYWNMTEN